MSSRKRAGCASRPNMPFPDSRVRCQAPGQPVQRPLIYEYPLRQAPLGMLSPGRTSPSSWRAAAGAAVFVGDVESLAAHAATPESTNARSRNRECVVVIGRSL